MKNTKKPGADKSAETVKLEETIASLTNDLQRTRADFENYRKQVDLQKTQAQNMARLATVSKFLPLLDDIDRAIAAYSEQLAPLAKNLDKTLTDLELAKIDSKVGVEFNPDFHDAVMVDDSEGEKEVIAETLRPGYLYQGEVLRPAMVKVTHK
ncbi:nucleotide exchange factor GrpE [Candidatus Saccharibacteria bacterium]|nr:nucleotide exchange factor GrpE [Candidatus Saccharibacteria bacterium]